MNPPQHAAVVRVDEKTAIQALDRLEGKTTARHTSAEFISFLTQAKAVKERNDRDSPLVHVVAL